MAGQRASEREAGGDGRADSGEREERLPVWGRSVGPRRAAPLNATHGLVQRQQAPDALRWRNATIAASNRIQEILRATQQARRSQVEIDLTVDPEFVEIGGFRMGAAAFAGSDPNGLALYSAAEQVFRSFILSPPTSRRVMTLVYERTPVGWSLNRFAVVGETIPVSAGRILPISAAQQELRNLLSQALAARHSDLRLDLAFTQGGVQILSWRASGSSGNAGAHRAETGSATRWLADLAGLAGQRTLVYELRHSLVGGAWEVASTRRLGEVMPGVSPAASTSSPGAAGGTVPDDVEQIVADIQGTRRLVLDAAAEAIAEQDPTRLENILFSLGPLALVGVLRVGRIVRIGRRWRPRLITDAVCRVGCENVARQIQRHIGGEIVRITPRNAPTLGRFRGHNWRWSHHEVVVREGRVYDLTTGHQGLPVAEYRRLWEYPDGIDFGF